MSEKTFFSDTYPDHKQVLEDLKRAVSFLDKEPRILDPQPFIGLPHAEVVAVDKEGCIVLLKVLGEKDGETELVSMTKAWLRLEEAASSLCSHYGVRSSSSLKALIFSRSFSEEQMKILSLFRIDITSYEYHYISRGEEKALFLRKRSSELQQSNIPSPVKDIPKTLPTDHKEPEASEPPKAEQDEVEEEIPQTSQDLTILSKEEISEFIKLEDEFKKIFSTA